MSFGTDMAAARHDRETLDPADFEFAAEYYVGPNPDMQDMMAGPLPSGFDRCAEMGKCDHCGTPHHFGAIFRDLRDGSYMVIGNVCAGQFFTFPSRKSYVQAQAGKKAARRREREAAREAGEEFLATRLDLQEAFKVDHYIIADIREKLFRYGSISEKQAAFVIRLALEELDREPEPEAKEIPAELLEGRHEFTGTVLGLKEKDTPWGLTCKMLFRDDRGFKLWGSALPAGVGDSKGDRVAFMARVERSKDDPCFGFFSRPTKGRKA